MAGCLRCQSSSSASYSVKDLEGYKLVCTSFGETWKAIHIPGQTTTSTTALPTTTLPPVPSDGSSSGGTSTNTNHLSSGAIAGIVVSVVALVVALSVAGYVWRRRRENLQPRTDDEYKYSDSQRDSYMEVALPQYTGMIQPTLPPIAKVSNLRVMNPDSDDEDHGATLRSRQQEHSSFEVNRNSSPGWRRGSFDDD
ncbi:hypothetical protein BG011_008537 [Mortierella polycephala]|uniref:Mid2 domain-containing protein n=1 Tax=Mortierella polycephala TaxID=41804 RepID=A0A9P6QCF4_9FUNG|nr:hypothetical protein BG011_008537 [Mortierella polycephala]